MRREELAQPVLMFRTHSQAEYITLSVMHCIAVNCELKDTNRTAFAAKNMRRNTLSLAQSQCHDKTSLMSYAKHMCSDYSVLMRYQNCTDYVDTSGYHLIASDLHRYFVANNMD